MLIAYLATFFLTGCVLDYVLGYRRARAKSRFERRMLWTMLSARMAGIAHEEFARLGLSLREDLEKLSEEEDERKQVN